ncbi:MAG TPA: M56 family metallopeptidase, partial [Lacipirellulaceae bacterium]
MNTLARLGGIEPWQLAGWTMLHFLWVGSIVGIGAVVCRLTVRRAPAHVRYTLALVALGLLAASPVGVAVWLAGHGDTTNMRVDATVVACQPGNSILGDDDMLEPMESAANPRQSRQPGDSPELMRVADDVTLTELAAMCESCACYLPWLWLFGTPLTFAVLTTGVVGAERLRRTSQLINEGPITEACARVTKAMQITRRVAVAVCERVAAPVLVGIVRPIILLPPAALTGWSMDELEMVLLHELAHVRRWDNLVNLVQRIIESLLFFHPMVWLVSSWVRREREACCDAVVIGRTEQPHAYAELLVALAAQMPRSVLFYPAASSAMAAGPLRARIRRILQLEDDPMLVSRKSLLVVLGGLLVAAAAGVLYVPSPIQAEQQPDAGAGATSPKLVSSAADALEEYRQILVTYNLDFDSGFPQQPWRAPDPKQLERYPTPDAWPNILGHADTDASAYRVVREKLDAPYENVTGPNAYLVPLTWNVGTKNYATLLFLKGVEPGANVMVHSYGSVACFGSMGGYLLFDSYATALVNGDLSGQVTAKSYFDLVVTGKFTGRITTQSYAMIYLMGGLAGNLELKNSKVYIAGRTPEAELSRISGVGQLYLEDSDLPAGQHKIGNLVVTVGEPNTTPPAKRAAVEGTREQSVDGSDMAATNLGAPT